jgi:RHS repeat-associated protein
VVTGSSGTVVKTISYDSFGEIMADSNSSFVLPVGFAGGLADAATGLVYFGARDYDPAAGRWTARDPQLFDAEQANLYQYVGNDPLNYRDADGLQSAPTLRQYAPPGSNGSDPMAQAQQIVDTVQTAKKVVDKFEKYGDLIVDKSKSPFEKAKTICDKEVESKIKGLTQYEPGQIADEYYKKVKESKEQATQNSTTLVDKLIQVWQTAADALTGSSSSTQSSAPPSSSSQPATPPGRP